MIAKLEKLFAYLLRKYPHYSEDFAHFINIYGFAKSNRHLLRGFLNVIDDFRQTMRKGSHLNEEEYRLLDEILLELELAIALETSGIDQLLNKSVGPVKSSAGTTGVCCGVLGFPHPHPEEAELLA